MMMILIMIMMMMMMMMMMMIIIIIIIIIITIIGLPLGPLVSWGVQSRSRPRPPRERTLEPVNKVGIWNAGGLTQASFDFHKFFVLSFC